jgi:hypothetical protein
MLMKKQPKYTSIHVHRFRKEDSGEIQCLVIGDPRAVGLMLMKKNPRSAVKHIPRTRKGEVRG